MLRHSWPTTFLAHGCLAAKFHETLAADHSSLRSSGGDWRSSYPHTAGALRGGRPDQPLACAFRGKDNVASDFPLAWTIGVR